MYVGTRNIDLSWRTTNYDLFPTATTDATTSTQYTPSFGHLMHINASQATLV